MLKNSTKVLAADKRR